MNKVVVNRHVRAGDLPEDFRGDIAPTSLVTLTVTEEVSSKSAGDLLRDIQALRASPDFKPVSVDEAVRRVRELRDEWDD